MRRLIVHDDENNNADFQEEQWEEADSVAFVASASEDGDVVMWDVKNKEVLQRIERAHDGVCFWVDVHGETGTMVSCGKDMRIVVYRHRYPESRDDEKRLPVANGIVKSEELASGGISPEEENVGPEAEESDAMVT